MKILEIDSRTFKPFLLQIDSIDELSSLLSVMYGVTEEQGVFKLNNTKNSHPLVTKYSHKYVCDLFDKLSERLA